MRFGAWNATVAGSWYGIVLGGLSAFDLFTVGDVVNEIWARIEEVQ